MKVKKLSAVLALCAASCLASAESYQGEVLAAYTDVDGEVDIIAVGGQYHFAAVNTDSHPLAEADFLEKSNNISLLYAQSDFDGGDSDSALAQVEIYIPSAMLYIAPFYEYASFSYDGFGSESENDWGTAIGITPIDGLRIATTWSDEVDYELNLEAKYVVKLAGETALNFDFGYQKSPDSEFDDTIGAAVDYYFDRTFSVGIELEDSSDTGVGIRTEKFFTEQFHMLARYFTVDDVNMWTIGAAYRF